MSDEGSGSFQLAQVNVMHLKAPLDSAALQPFVAALAPVNALADQAPGFVWRLQTPDGDATALRVFGDDTLLVNMSTWTSLEALADYVYRSAHAEIMRRRREFALPAAEAYVALWWVPAGHRPTVREAEDRLRHLRLNGPTPFAFGVRSPFPAPPSGAAPAVRDDDICRA